LARSFARISSGQRLQSAGDDPIGLSISGRFSSQIQGDHAAQRNAEDGLSLARSAESTLSESSQLIQKLRERAIMASSDSLSEEDRQSLQAELSSLLEELEAVANRSRYNNRELLKGGFSEALFQLGSRESLEMNLADARPAALGLQATHQGDPVSSEALVAGDLSINGVEIRASLESDDLLSSHEAAGSAIAKAAAINESSEHHGVSAWVGPTELISPLPVQGGVLSQDKRLILNGVVLGDLEIHPGDAGHRLVAAINAMMDQTGVSASIDAGGHLRLRAEDGRNIHLQGLGGAELILGLPPESLQTARLNLYSDEEFELGGAAEDRAGFPDALQVQVDASEALSTLSFETRFEAEHSLLKLDRALKQISLERGRLGHSMGRLEQSLSSLASSLEQSLRARSTIQDADLARESSEMAREQILQQSGLSILSQANASGEQILSLLGAGR